MMLPVLTRGPCNPIFNAAPPVLSLGAINLGFTALVSPNLNEYE